jgi:hypothetical protein
LKKTTIPEPVVVAGTSVVVAAAGVVLGEVAAVAVAIVDAFVVVFAGAVLPDVAVVFPPNGFGVVAAVELAFCFWHVSILPAVSLSATLHAPNAGKVNSYCSELYNFYMKRFKYLLLLLILPLSQLFLLLI